MRPERDVEAAAEPTSSRMASRKTTARRIQPSSMVRPVRRPIARARKSACASAVASSPAPASRSLSMRSRTLRASPSRRSHSLAAVSSWRSCQTAAHASAVQRVGRWHWSVAAPSVRVWLPALTAAASLASISLAISAAKRFAGDLVPVGFQACELGFGLPVGSDPVVRGVGLAHAHLGRQAHGAGERPGHAHGEDGEAGGRREPPSFPEAEEDHERHAALEDVDAGGGQRVGVGLERGPAQAEREAVAERRRHRHQADGDEGARAADQHSDWGVTLSVAQYRRRVSSWRDRWPRPGPATRAGRGDQPLIRSRRTLCPPLCCR